MATLKNLLKAQGQVHTFETLGEYSFESNPFPSPNTLGEHTFDELNTITVINNVSKSASPLSNQSKS